MSRPAESPAGACRQWRGALGRWHVRTLVVSAKGHKLKAGFVLGGGMGLALVVVVMIVAGGLIPGDSQIRFYR
jgi:hypothetical protein